jgi:hypothetical protein
LNSSKIYSGISNTTNRDSRGPIIFSQELEVAKTKLDSCILLVLLVFGSASSFVNSSKLAKQYQYDLFVGDAVNGNLYRFDLDKRRADLPLNATLSDRIINSDAQIKSKVFLGGFGQLQILKLAITDTYTLVL